MVQVIFGSETPALLYPVAQNMCSLPNPTRIRQVCNNYPSSINTKPQEQRKKIQRDVTLTLWRTQEKRKYSLVQWYVIIDEHCSSKFPRFRPFVLLLSAAYSCRWVWSAAGKMGTKGSGNSGRKARLSTANSNGLTRNRTLSSVERGRLLTTFWRQRVRFIVFNHSIPTPQRINCVSIKTTKQFTNGSYRRSNTTIH